VEPGVYIKISFFLSFFGVEEPTNHWSKRMVNIQNIKVSRPKYLCPVKINRPTSFDRIVEGQFKPFREKNCTKIEK